MQKPIVLGSMDVARLVGIQPTLLNKFIERQQYGIAPSFRSGEGRGKERLFDEDDIYGIALAHWLFESGLRSDSIQFVLNQIVGGFADAKARNAAYHVRKAEVLVITRQPRSGYAKHPVQKTELCGLARASQLVRETASSSVLLIPVRSLFANLEKKMGDI
jgi:hypothetical protein